MAAPHSTLDSAKRAARATALAARKGCDPALGQALTRYVLETCAPDAGVAVSGFWPIPGEIDIRPLLQALHERGHPVLLPVTPPLGQPLGFRRWTPGATMVAERFGTCCPGPVAADGGAADGIPKVLFVPLVAFDRRGRRLGYGGGYYDRTLAALPGAVAIGCAFAAQELDEVPAADYDVPLRAIATERGVIFCESP